MNDPSPARGLGSPAAPARRPSGLARTLLCAFAAAAIGYALEQRDGAFDGPALFAVGLALLSLAIAALGPGLLDLVGQPHSEVDTTTKSVGIPSIRALTGGAREPGALFGESGAKLFLAALVLLQLLLQFARPPGLDLHPIPGGPWPFWLGLGVAIALTICTLLPEPPLGKLRWPLLLAVHAALAFWVLRASPSPQIDVFLFHRAGFAALLDGQSPYATSIPLLYGDARFYGEGLVRDGIVYVGHPYPPLSFALTFLAWFIAGDYRVALLLAVTFSGWCIAELGQSVEATPSPQSGARQGPGRRAIGELCALLLLFSPRTFFVLEQGWTEPLVVAFVCALVLSVSRAPRTTRWLLGGLLAVKQYGCFALPFLPLLSPNETRTQLVKRALFACAVALAVTLPLALISPRAFVDSVLLFQLRQPFRADALSFAAALFRHGGPALPGWVSFAVLLPAIALALRFAPRSSGGFLAALALAFAAFFDVGKQAFANYHFLVLALAAATASALANPGPAPRLTGAAARD